MPGEICEYHIVVEDIMDSQDRIQRAMDVKHRHEEELMAQPGVIGVGVGFRDQGGAQSTEVAIVVLVEKKRPASELALDQLLPRELEGVPVDVLETGSIDARSSDW
jgi:hypothetical protein